MIRLHVAQLSFADLQLQHVGVRLDPRLQWIGGLLEQHAGLVELVRQDLARGLKKTAVERLALARSRPCAR